MTKPHLAVSQDDMLDALAFAPTVFTVFFPQLCFCGKVFPRPRMALSCRVLMNTSPGMSRVYRTPLSPMQKLLPPAACKKVVKVRKVSHFHIKRSA